MTLRWKFSKSPWTAIFLCIATVLFAALSSKQVTSAFLVNLGNVELNRVLQLDISLSSSDLPMRLFKLAGTLSPTSWRAQDGLGDTVTR